VNPRPEGLVIPRTSFLGSFTGRLDMHVHASKIAAEKSWKEPDQTLSRDCVDKVGAGKLHHLGWELVPVVLLRRGKE
jgi:hypothetical protein